MSAALPLLALLVACQLGPGPSIDVVATTGPTGPTSTLVAQFATPGALASPVALDLGGPATFSRSSTRLCRTGSTYQSIASNTLCVETDGALTEPSVTNDVPSSTDLSTGSWTSFGSITVTGAQCVGPDGTASMTRLTSSALPASRYQLLTSSDSVTHTAQMALRDGPAYLDLGFSQNIASDSCSVVCENGSQPVCSIVNFGAAEHLYQATATGLCRLMVAVTLASSGHTNVLGITPGVYTTTTTGTVCVSNVQHDLGQIPTTYQPTGTRADEAMSVPITGLVGTQAGSGSTWVEPEFASDGAAADRTVLASNGPTLAWINSSQAWRLSIGGATATSSAPAYSAGGKHLLRWRWSVGGQACVSADGIETCSGTVSSYTPSGNLSLLGDGAHGAAMHIQGLTLCAASGTCGNNSANPLPIVHLDSAVVGASLSANQTITEWRNTGSDLNARQTADTGHQPTYRSTPAVFFNGVFDNMILPASAKTMAGIHQGLPFDIVLQYRTADPLYHQLLVGAQGTGSDQGLQIRSDDTGHIVATIWVGNHAIATLTTTWTEGTLGTWQTLEVTGDGTTLSVSRDLSTYQTVAYSGAVGTGAASQDYVVGALTADPRAPQTVHPDDGVFQGELGDLAVYGRVLSGAERAAIRSAYATRAAAARAQIVTGLGDSITAIGYTTGTLTGNNTNAWPALVALSVGNGWLAYGAGVGFDTCQNIRATRWPDVVRPLVAATPGKRIAIACGVNDLGLNGRTGAQIAADVEAMLSDAVADGDAVTVSTIGPYRGFGYWSSQGETDRLAFNTAIRTYAMIWGIPVVDNAAILADSGDASLLAATYDGGDHLHPNDAGEAALAAAQRSAWGL